MPVRPVFPFTPKMRSKALTLHDPSQLSGQFTKAWRDTDHFVQYLSRRHQIHRILDPVVTVNTGLSERLQGDLLSLDTEWKRHCVPADNQYANYLCTLDTQHARQKLIAHYYAFVLAHLVGGGQTIARSAASVVPAGYVENSWYYNLEDADLLAKTIVRDIDDEAVYWTLDQEQTCLDELDTAFCFGLQIMHQ